jgi:cyclic pyranopterin monophosphate synthase
MLTHVTPQGQPTMVAVGEKAVTARSAWAQARLRVPASLGERLANGELQTAKGPVFATAIIAGTMGCKRTSDLIPFCHPIALEDCKLAVAMADATTIVIDCRVATHHKTGVEMEALTGASIAALTVYDMCKALSHDLVIEQVRLMEKRGGKRDFRAAEAG